MSASTGTLMAAFFEGAGMRQLSYEITELTSFLHGLGVLAFVISILIGIISVATSGSYQGAKWLIVGPSLFYFLMFYTVDSTGAEWRFGTFSDKDFALKRNEKPYLQSAEESYGVDTSKTIKVPWLYDRFNKLVSNMVQEMIRVVTRNDSFNAQVRHLSRARIYDLITNAKVQDTALRDFSMRAFQGECADVVNDLSLLAVGRRDLNFQNSHEWTRAITRIKQEHTYTIKDIVFPGGTPTQAYLRDLLNQLYAMESNSSQVFDTQLRDYCAGEDPENLIPLKDDFRLADKTDKDFQAVGCNTGTEIEKKACWQAAQPHSCQQILCWTFLGLHAEANKIMAKAECSTIPKQANLCADTTSENNPLPEQEQAVISVWQSILAKNAPAAQGADNNENRLATVHHDIVGGFIREALKGDRHSAQLSELAKKAGYQYKQTISNPNTLDEGTYDDLIRRENQHVAAEGSRYELYTFFLLIPHLQGIMLYLLAVIYPFIAFMVIIPGRGQLLFMWMAGLAWVKQIDLCMAIWSVFDDILWDLFPHYSSINQYRYENPGIESESATATGLGDYTNGPLSILESAFRGDPAYHLATYWMLTCAVGFGLITFSARVMLNIWGNGSLIPEALLGKAKEISEHFRKLGESAPAMEVAKRRDSQRIVAQGNQARASANRTGTAESTKKYPEIDRMMAALNTLQTNASGKFEKSMANNLLATGVAASGLATTIAGRFPGLGGLLGKAARVMTAGGLLSAVGGHTVAEQERMNYLRALNIGKMAGELRRQLERHRMELEQVSTQVSKEGMFLSTMYNADTIRNEFWTRLGSGAAQEQSWEVITRRAAMAGKGLDEAEDATKIRTALDGMTTFAIGWLERLR